MITLTDMMGNNNEFYETVKNAIDKPVISCGYTFPPYFQETKYGEIIIKILVYHIKPVTQNDFSFMKSMDNYIILKK